MGLISEIPRALLLALKVFTPGADDREVMTGRRHVLCRGYLRSSLGVVSPGHGENPALPWLIAGRTHRVCGGWSKAARRRSGRRDGRDRRRDGLPGGAGHRRRRDRAATATSAADTTTRWCGPVASGSRCSRMGSAPSPPRHRGWRSLQRGSQARGSAGRCGTPKLAARLPRGVCGIVRVEANAIRTQPNAGAGPNRVLREPRRGWVYGAATRALTCMHALGWTRAGTTGSSGSLGSM
jgi:hypothetical protein